METKLYYSNTQKQNGESFLNFTPLFLLSLSKICITAYFIPPSEYSNHKADLVTYNTYLRLTVKTRSHCAIATAW